MKKYYIDMHTTPASVFKIIFGDDKTKKIKKYKGQNKWMKANEEELRKLIDVGSAREVSEDIAKEFILDFDKSDILNNFIA